MQMNYTTQMDAAKKGILTKEMKAVAEKEQFDARELMSLVAEGKVAIPANRLHACLEPNGIHHGFKLLWRHPGFSPEADFGMSGYHWYRADL